MGLSIWEPDTVTGQPTSVINTRLSRSLLRSSASCNWVRQWYRKSRSRDQSVSSNARRAAPTARRMSSTVPSVA